MTKEGASNSSSGILDCASVSDIVTFGSIKSGCRLLAQSAGLSNVWSEDRLQPEEFHRGELILTMRSVVLFKAVIPKMFCRIVEAVTLGACGTNMLQE